MAVIVALLVTILLSLLVHFIPGNPAQTILGPRATPELVAQVNREMGLDKPISTQVWDFVRGAAQGNFGTDIVTGAPVSSLVAQALPHTIILAVVSLGLAVLVGVPLGAYASSHPNTIIDRVTAVLSVSLITIPPYVGGLLLLLVFAVSLHWLPAIGAGSLSDPVSYIEHLILPAVALALTWIGYLARLVRTSMLEVLGANYIRTARALGVRRGRVVYKYALRNAIIPTVAILGVGLGTLLGGAIFVEVIFDRPGLGTLMFNAIGSRDYPIVRAGALVIALLFVLANLLADISYRFLDPRIRAMEGSR